MDDSSMVTLAQEFAELGSQLRDDEADNEAVMARMLELASKHVPGCCWASITTVERGRGRTLAASDDVALAADRLQYELDEGPCLSSAIEDTTHALFDVSTDRQWPRYAAALREQTPIRGVLSFQLPAKESAALNLYRDDTSTFDDSSLLVGAVFAAQASSLVGLYESEKTSKQLTTALVSSRDIGAAIGILMSHHKITQQAAYDLLSNASQSLNRKLRDLANRIVETGEVPDTGPGPLR